MCLLVLCFCVVVVVVVEARGRAVGLSGVAKMANGKQGV